MHGSLHTAGTEAGFVDILHRTNGLQTSGLFKKSLHDAMLKPLVTPDARRFLLWRVIILPLLFLPLFLYILLCFRWFIVLAVIQRESVNEPHINQQECYLDKWIFITVQQLKDQRCKCWERKKGILTWTMRLMRRASEETHTDGEWWRNPIRTLISTERILQNVK